MRSKFEALDLYTLLSEFRAVALQKMVNIEESHKDEIESLESQATFQDLETCALAAAQGQVSAQYQLMRFIKQGVDLPDTRTVHVAADRRLAVAAIPTLQWLRSSGLGKEIIWQCLHAGRLPMICIGDDEDAR